MFSQNKNLGLMIMIKIRLVKYKDLCFTKKSTTVSHYRS